MAKKFSPHGAKPSDDARDISAAKTLRLRTLRLAKEAADKELALQEAAAKAAAPPRRRVRAPASPPGDAPT